MPFERPATRTQYGELNFSEGGAPDYYADFEDAMVRSAGFFGAQTYLDDPRLSRYDGMSEPSYSNVDAPDAFFMPVVSDELSALYKGIYPLDMQPTFVEPMPWDRPGLVGSGLG